MSESREHFEDSAQPTTSLNELPGCFSQDIVRLIRDRFSKPFSELRMTSCGLDWDWTTGTRWKNGH